MILDDKLKSRLRNDYSSFFLSETMYSNLQVPWKRGIILMGVGNIMTYVGNGLLTKPSAATRQRKDDNAEGNHEVGWSTDAIRQVLQK